MFRAIGMTAGFLRRTKLHHFDARSVRIVRIETVLAIAADFWTIERSEPVRAKLGHSTVNVFHAE